MKPARKYYTQYTLDPLLINYVRDDGYEEALRRDALQELLVRVSLDVITGTSYAFNITEHRDVNFAGIVIVRLLLMLYESEA